MHMNIVTHTHIYDRYIVHKYITIFIYMDLQGKYVNVCIYICEGINVSVFSSHSHTDLIKSTTHSEK